MFVKYSARHAVIIVHESGKLGLFIISRKEMRETNTFSFQAALYILAKRSQGKTLATNMRVYQHRSVGQCGPSEHGPNENQPSCENWFE